jgi:hypothetical protein
LHTCRTDVGVNLEHLTEREINLRSVVPFDSFDPSSILHTNSASGPASIGNLGRNVLRDVKISASKRGNTFYARGVPFVSNSG